MLGAVRHSGPLRVQKPFYPEAGLCHAYVLHPPGGLVGGDDLTINVHAEADVEVLLTTPAAGKFYRSTGMTAVQRQNLYVADGACCEWLPQENILFDGALSKLFTEVRLAADARFIGWEINGLGRPAADLLYRRGCHNQRFAIYRDGNVFYLDRLKLNGDRDVYHAPWGLRGRCVSGLLAATPADDAALAAARSVTAEHGETIAACTLIQDEDLLLCRCLSDDTQSVRRYMIQLWHKLRPFVVGRKACEPRIWAT